MALISLRRKRQILRTDETLEEELEDDEEEEEIEEGEEEKEESEETLQPGFLKQVQESQSCTEEELKMNWIRMI